MCRGLPADGELPGAVSLPYSQAYREVRSTALRKVPSTYTSRVASVPPPDAESGMEKRVTRVLVGALAVNSTDAPVRSSVTARRPEASPARSPMVRFGPTTTAPPARTPSSAS